MMMNGRVLVPSGRVQRVQLDFPVRALPVPGEYRKSKLRRPGLLSPSQRMPQHDRQPEDDVARLSAFEGLGQFDRGHLWR